MSFLKICFCIVLLSAISLYGQINPTISSSTSNFSLTCLNPTISLTANSSFSGSVSYTWTNPQLNVVNGNSISAATLGTYTLSTSSGTILETLTVNIVTNTIQPAATLMAAVSSITCNTPTVLMTAINSPTNVSYTWIEPGVGFGCTSSTCIAATPGIYGVTVKDQLNGCQKTTTINIGDNRFYPVFSSIGLYTIACPNGTVSLEPSLTTATTNLTFQWKVPPNAITSATNNLQLITNAPGEYTLTATNTVNGCITNALVSVYACVGILENTSDSLNLYPNPVNKKVRISTGYNFTVTITVLNSLGQVMFSNSDYELPGEIELESLKPGIYYILITAKDKTVQRKLIKE